MFHYAMFLCFCVIKPLCQEWAQDRSPQSLSGCLEQVECPLEDP